MVNNLLHARPNLEHLRHQAKTLLASLKDGDASSAQAFIDHLPAARQMSHAKVRSAGFRLADAQSVVARTYGFETWALLSRHVKQLHMLEGEWRFVGIQVDGRDMSQPMLAQSRLLIDGSSFRMESASANFDGVFSIDSAREPMHIDIDFIEGPEAGNRAQGIFELDGDRLTICLGVVGASRPLGFSTRPGSGHALERLRRRSPARPAGVSGGRRQAAPPAQPPDTKAQVDARAFDVAMTPLLRRLEGEWEPVRLVQNGEEMQASWLPFGRRIANGNEVKVVFGGQTMLHAKARLDERATPVAIDYLHLTGPRGRVSLGIMEWMGDDVRFLIASPGQARPSAFVEPPDAGHTLSQWRKL